MAVTTSELAVRAPLTRERVLQAAIELADGRDGVEGLSMRKLGQALRVEAMSLYNHVSNKSDLLSAMLDLVIDEIELPPADEDWKPALRRTAVSAYITYLAHPWAANLTLSAGTGARRFAYMEAILGCLRLGGFSAEMTHHAYHALESHIVGFTLWVVGITAGLAGMDGQVEDYVARFREPYPYLAEHAEEHLKPRGPDDKTEFEFGLDLLLDGLERMLG